MKSKAWVHVAATIGVIGGLAAIMAATSVVARPGATSRLKVLGASHNSAVVLPHTAPGKQIVSLGVPSGKFAIFGKLWGDSLTSVTANTVVRCGLFKGSRQVDVSVFNTGKTTGNTSAGVIALNFVQRLRHAATFKIKCDDLGSNAQVHDAKLTATGAPAG